MLGGLTPFESRGEIKISVYGESGTGKTSFWASFPGPILVILCSGGKGTNELDSLSARERKKVTPFYLGDPAYGTGTCDDLLTLAEELASDTHYKTIVIDHLSGIQDLRITEILDLDEIPEQKSWGLATREEYGERALNMKHYIRRFMDLVDKKVVFISQELTVEPGEKESELDLLPSVGPYLSESVVEWFNPAVNYICRTFIKHKTVQKESTIGKSKKIRESVVKGKFDYCLMTGPSDVYTTKFRMPKEKKKPPFIVNPTYDKVMKLITEDE